MTGGGRGVGAPTGGPSGDGLSGGPRGTHGEPAELRWGLLERPAGRARGPAGPGDQTWL